VAPQRLAERRHERELAGAVGVEGEHRSGGVAVVQGGETTAGGVDIVDHHGLQRLAGGGLEGGLVPGVDVDQIEQGADDATDPGQRLGTGPSAGLVERLTQRLGPGGPGVTICVGGTHAKLRFLGGGLGGHPAPLGHSQPVDQRDLGVGGLVELGPQPRPLGIEPGRLGVERGDPAAHPFDLGRRLAETAAQGRQLAPRLGRLAAGGGHPARPQLLEAGALGGQRSLGRCQRVGGRRQLPRLLLDAAEVVGEAGGLGLERGDDGGVDAGAAVALDAAPSFHQHRRQAAGPFPQ
jgi:hypothetical protein